MQHSRILAHGLRVRYWQYHPQATTTMVLIHGFTGNHKGFQYIIPLLPNIRFIVPDLPGFGETDLPQRSDWSVDAIARLTNEFVQALQLPTPPHILGHSMGGLVVSSMVRQAPDLYDSKMILLSPVPTAITKNDKRRAGAILGALQYGLGYKLPKVGERLVKNRTITRAITHTIMTTSDRQLRKAIHEHHFDNLNYISSIEFYSKLHHDINRQGAIDNAAALRKKELLLISGNADNVTPLAEMKKLVLAAKPKKFIVLDGVGHLAHYERPQEVSEAISLFLDLR